MDDTVQFHAANAEGEYTVQTVSISEFYNRLRDQEAAENVLPRATDLGPKYGLLSECLSTSPVIKTILSASIRCDTDESYIALVGERHIELRVLNDRLNLEPLVSKNDFYCKIRSASLLDIKKGSSAFLQQIKQEDGTPFLFSSTATPKIPKQVLVVALESGELGFIYLDVTPRGRLEFVFATHRISPEQPKALHVGRSISVDFHSRAMAVCAWEACFKLYETHDAAAMEQKMATGQSFIPLRHEKTFQVPGTILSLEFLRSSDPDHVMWIVLYVNRDTKVKQMRLLLYEWNTKEPLCKATKLSQDGLRLPDKWGLPTHVVPLTIATFFVLICKQNIYIGKAADIANGNCRWKNFPIPSASPWDIKLVTAWARPHRNPGYAQRNDDFYIAKENGELFWIYINNSQATWGPSIETVKSGKLQGGVGSAFAFHEVRTENSSDLLVAAGEACCGGTYLITPKQPNGPVIADEPRFIQEIYNWTPMFDADIHTIRNSSKSNLVFPRARLYTSSGIGEHGSVSEIRRGIEARVAEEYVFDAAITKVIVLHGPNERGCFVLGCMVLGTALWYIDYGDLRLHEVAETISLRTGDHTRTLTAGAHDGRCVQVTTNGVYSTMLDEADVEALVQVPTPRQEWDCPPGHEIVSAALREDVVILVMRTSSGYQLWNMALQPVSGGDQDGLLLRKGTPVSLPCQPTFLDFIRIGARTYLLAENSGVTLDFYQIGEDGDITLQTQVSTTVRAAGHLELSSMEMPSPIVESACALEVEGKTFLVCGLRDGCVSFGEIDPESLGFRPLGHVRIGRLPVLLSMRDNWSDRVLAHTTHALHQLTIQRSMLVVLPIVFNQTQEVPGIETVCHLNHDLLASSFPYPIVFATGASLVLGMLGGKPGICTRQIQLDESPSKVIYIEREDLLAVAVHRRNPYYPREGEDRKTCPTAIIFLRPRSGESVGTWDLKDWKYKDMVFSKRHERINCLLNVPDWTFPDEGVNWTCILVGTSYLPAGEHQQRGRILVISLHFNRLATGELRFEIRKRNQILLQEPVHCMAVYGSNSLVVGAERSLYKMDLNRDTLGNWRFEGLVGQPVSSTPTQITVEPATDMIWVSSMRDILAAYRFREAPAPTFHRLYSDDRERAGRNHLRIEENFFLAADRDEGVIGLWMPNERRTSTNLTKVFDGYIPNSVASIRAGDLRTPWKPRNRFLPGVIRPDIDVLGTCFDGSIYHLTVLSAPATSLLLYLQQRYLRFLHPDPKSRKGKSPLPRHRQVDGIREGSTRHVDGNILLESLETVPEWLGGAMPNEDDELLERLVRDVFRDAETAGGLIRPGMTTVDVVEAYLRELVGVITL